MGLESPAVLLLALLLLPLVWWLHLRRQARPVVLLHAPWLLPPSARLRQGGRRGWRDWLHLLLRLLLAGGLLVALAAPWVRGFGPDRMVVVVERGLAMALPLPDGRTRYLAALDDAEAALRTSRPRRALILLAGAEPEAAGGWASPEAALEAARAVPPGQGPSDPVAALREARRLAGAEGTVVLAQAPWAPVAGNRSIVRLSFRPSRAEPERGILGVLVRSQAAEGNATLLIESEAGPLPRMNVELPSSGEQLAAVHYKGPGDGALRVRLLDPDPFPADDEAWIYLPRLSARSVTLLTPHNPELERALRANPRIRLTTLPPGSPLPPTTELIVADREDPARWTIPGPPVVLVVPRGGEVGLHEAVASSAEGLVVDPGETRPGVLALANLVPRQVARLVPTRTALPLAWLGAAPMVLVDSAARIRLLLAFDPGLAGLGGSALHAVLWDDLLDPLLLPPNGGCQQFTVGERTPAGVLERPGVYRVRGECLVANLPEVADPTGGLRAQQALEAGGPPALLVGSAPVPVPDEEQPVQQPPAARAAQLAAAHRPVAALLALLLWGLLAVEWLFARRSQQA